VVFVVLVAGFRRVMMLVLIGVAIVTVMMGVFAGVAVVAVMMLVLRRVLVRIVVVIVLVGVAVLAMVMLVFVGMVVGHFLGMTVGQGGGCCSQREHSRGQNDGAALCGEQFHGHVPRDWNADTGFILN
jgi:hypothetical protein